MARFASFTIYSIVTLLARLMGLAMIFSREANLVFLKILAREIAKRDSLSTLAGSAGEFP
jgi:hypothetical protein